MKLSISRFNEALEFANKQFLDKDSEINFLQIQPKVYSYPSIYAEKHYIFEGNNKKIAGMIGTYPIELGSLNCLGIGTVCVDKSYRNQGIMSHIFHEIDSDIKDKYDLLYLSGDKKRYEYYGFYKTGRNITLKISNRLFPTNLASANISLYLRNDNDITNKLFNLYSLETNMFRRDPNRYYDILKTGRSEVYLLKTSDFNEIVAYIVYHPKNELIAEIIYNGISLEDVLANFMKYLNLEYVNYQVSLNHKDIKKLYDFSVKNDISTLINLRIENYAKVIKYFLEKKNNLLNGEIRFKIENKILTVIVQKSKILVREIIIKEDLENSEEQYDFELSNKEMHELLFDFYLIFNPKFEHKLKFIKSWFPFYLPSTISNIDSF